jgi:ABC-type branched-subunit amino acid transport system substrate-binding protein
MDRRLANLLIVAVLAGACTSQEPGTPPSPSPAVPSPTAAPGPEPVILDVVADLGPTEGLPNSYVDGMRLALNQINSGRGVEGRPVELALHDHGGDSAEATRLITGVLTGGPTAVLYAGPGTALSPLRAQFAESGAPVFLLGGDLYTSRGLFPQVFQTTIPWEWQANAIARYAVTDREDDDVVFFGTGPEASVARDSLEDAMSYWGGDLDDSFVIRSGGTPGRDPYLRALAADRVVTFGTDVDSPLDLVKAVEEMAQAEGETRLPGFTASSALLGQELLASLPDGVTACYPYTWSGWAQLVPRVGEFRDKFLAFTGRLPTRLEQEGYDAIRTLVLALRQTGGLGGPKLIDALEETQDRTFSGFPIYLGPDDHLFAPRDELGLFAVPGPEDDLDPVDQGGESWMPLMRTFTYDGERTSVLDRDRKVFFPYWNKNLPGPKYWRSRYGIVTRPGQDPLH